jgi:hypothetical protein
MMMLFSPAAGDSQDQEVTWNTVAPACHTQHLQGVQQTEVTVPVVAWL